VANAVIDRQLFIQGEAASLNAAKILRQDKRLDGAGDEELDAR
jgi:hypothetical protein